MRVVLATKACKKMKNGLYKIVHNCLTQTLTSLTVRFIKCFTIGSDLKLKELIVGILELLRSSIISKASKLKFKFWQSVLGENFIAISYLLSLLIFFFRSSLKTKFSGIKYHLDNEMSNQLTISSDNAGCTFAQNKSHQIWKNP